MSTKVYTTPTIEQIELEVESNILSSSTPSSDDSSSSNTVQDIKRGVTW